jgi:hypothetical protein
MLSTFFPQDSRRYQALPVLGPMMGQYAIWLNEQQYTWRSARYELRMAGRIAGYFHRRGFERIEDLDAQHLDACLRWFQRKYRSELGGFRLLIRFLREKGSIEAPVASAPANNGPCGFAEADRDPAQLPALSVCARPWLIQSIPIRKPLIARAC